MVTDLIVKICDGAVTAFAWLVDVCVGFNGEKKKEN